MKKSMGCLLAFGITIQIVYGQKLNGRKALAIGDTVPDIAFASMLQYKAPTAKLSDFKGKVIILDFWATWCAPCVTGLAELSKLKDRFAEDIVMLPVNNGLYNDTQALVEAFLRKRRDITLPSVYDTSRLLPTLFPHFGLPHSVIINKQGVLMAVTSSLYLTAPNLALLAKGELPYFPAASFRYSSITPTAGDAPGEKDEWSSRIFRYVPGAFGTSRLPVNDHTKTTYLNLTIPNLYKEAFRRPTYARHHRIKVEAAGDSAWYFNPFQDPIERYRWDSANCYCYQSLLPKSADSLTWRFMQEDLNRFLAARYGISARLATGPVRCLKMVARTPVQPPVQDSSWPEGFSQKAQWYHWRQVPLADIAKFLTNKNTPLPVIDGTGGDRPVNLTLHITQYSDLMALRPQFQQQGLDLIESVEELEIILITHNN